MVCLVGSLFRFYYETETSQLHLFFMPTDDVVAQMVNFHGVIDVSYDGATFELCGQPTVILRNKHDNFAGMTGVTWDAICKFDEKGWADRDLRRDRARGVVLPSADGSKYQLIPADDKDYKRWQRMREKVEAA